jgi:toxin CptA
VQFPIVIGLHRSRLVDASIVVAALAGAVAILVWPQPILVRMAVLVATAIATILAWRRAAPPCNALRLERDGTVAVQSMAGGEFVNAERLTGGFAHPWLAVVRWRDGSGQNKLTVVAVDSAQPADFRRLRLFLRWAANTGGAGDGR